MSNITAAGVLVGVLAMLFYTPYMFAKGVLSINRDELPMSEKLKCFIPIGNVISAEKYYWGKLWLVSYATIFFIIATVAKIGSWLLLHANSGINFVTSIAWMLAVVLFFVANCIDVFVILKETDATSIPKAILLAIIYPLGQWFIGAHVPNILKKMKNKENTFQT